MSKTESKVIYDGIVLYADGSYMATNGKLGAGVHGYAYKSEEPKKGAGAAKDVLTAKGYVPKADKDKVKQVTPVSYIDIVAPTDMGGSNNTAEIYAANIAVNHCKSYIENFSSFTNITIYTDSMYVVDGINKNSANWIARGWVKPDGTEIKNRPQWESLLSAAAEFPKLEVKWIKGHVGHLGNECADKLADLGRVKSEHDEYSVDTTVSDPDGYWKKNTQRHDLLAQKAAFFFTSGETAPGEYFTTNMVASDEFIGAARADCSIAVVRLKQPDTTLEFVKSRQREFKMDFNAMVLIRMDRIFQGQKADDLRQYGKYCLVPGTRPNATDLYWIEERAKNHDPVEGTPITEMLYPPGLAWRISDEAVRIHEYLAAYADKKSFDDENITLVDITSVFLTKGAKGPEFTKDIKNENDIVRVETTAFERTIQVPLTFNTHIMNKNNIRRLAQNGETSVQLLLVKENDSIIRFYTIVESDGEYTIWGAPHANTLFTKALRAKEDKK